MFAPLGEVMTQYPKFNQTAFLLLSSHSSHPSTAAVLGHRQNYIQIVIWDLEAQLPGYNVDKPHIRPRVDICTKCGISCAHKLLISHLSHQG